MKQFLLIISMCLFTYTAFSQETQEKDRIFDFAEMAPEYPGGVNALRKEIAKNYSIPQQYKGTGGPIILRFVVLEDGNIGEVKVLKGIKDCEACNQNGIKSIRNLSQKFSPGMQDGEPVKVMYTLPIVVKTEGKKKKKKRK